MQLKQLQEAIPAAASRISPVVVATPVSESLALSELTGCQVFLKLEHLQHTGSFKLRGATNKILALDDKARNAGVVAASTGNHGLGVSYAAARSNVQARIYLPHGVSEAKVRMIRGFGAEVVLHGDDCLEAELKARSDADETGKTFVSPYNDEEVIAGQGTVALELMQQVADLDAVFVSVGGGGLIAGIGAHIKSVSQKTRVYGCWPENSRVMLECLRVGQIVPVREEYTISESTAGGLEPGSITFDLCCSVIDEAALAEEEEIAAAMKLLAVEERWITEGAAGLALAGLINAAPDLKGKRVAVVLCGRNIAWEKFQSIIN